jgi:hypothetical protein
MPFMVVRQYAQFVFLPRLNLSGIMLSGRAGGFRH